MIKSFNGKTPKIAASAFVSEAAYIVGDVEIGENSSVWPGAVIRGDTGKVVIGKYTAIEDNCVVHSGIPGEGDTFIGDMSNIAHGAVIHGKKIGNNVLMGINATILHDAEIGNHCLIGAGCVVSEAHENPGQLLRRGRAGQNQGQSIGGPAFLAGKVPLEYAEFGKQYKEEGLGEKE